MDIRLEFSYELYNERYDIYIEDNNVGWVSFKEEKNTLNLDIIYIEKEYQRKGIGSSVIKRLLERYEKIEGYSEPTAIKFWQIGRAHV